MNLKALLVFSFACLTSLCIAQQVKAVYKIDELRARINTTKGIVVVNFWATWCKPCIQELPAFDSLTLSNPEIKVLLVCLDFKEEIDKKVNVFLKKHQTRVECVLLDEVNGNDFVNKISPKWSGAIPATLIKKGNTEQLYEKKVNLAELKHLVETIN